MKKLTREGSLRASYMYEEFAKLLLISRMHRNLNECQQQLTRTQHVHEHRLQSVKSSASMS